MYKFAQNLYIQVSSLLMLLVGAVPVQFDWLNSALSPVVYGDIALSINTQYNTIQYLFQQDYLNY